MNKVCFIGSLLLLLPLTACLNLKETGPGKPNILFIIVDDLGWTDLSSGAPNKGNGSKYYETPHVDRLAAMGMSFTDAYTCGPNCAPTRAALMSGQYGTRTKMYTVGDPDRSEPGERKYKAADNKRFLDLEQITLAESLKKAGYATAHFGKWHLGGHLGGGLPDQQGFDVNIAGTNAGGSTGGFFADSEGAFPPRGNAPAMPGLPPNGKAGEWLDDRLTGHALEFMEANRQKPFFVYLSFFAVHTPISAPEEDRAYFDHKPGTLRHGNQTYAGFIKSFDDNVGRLVGYLEKTDDPTHKDRKLIENTIVIFYSDNGGLGGFKRSGILATEITDQYPLREGKGSLKEGGIRVPLIIRWDRQVIPGSVNHTPVITVDFFPTFLELADWEESENLLLDGSSLVPVLRGESPAERSLYWHFPAYLQGYRDTEGKLSFRTTPASAIREGDWKLIHYYETYHWELYNLVADIGENNNLAGSEPYLLHKLGKKLIDWLVETKADLPRKKDTNQEVLLPVLPEIH